MLSDAQYGERDPDDTTPQWLAAASQRVAGLVDWVAQRFDRGTEHMHETGDALRWRTRRLAGSTDEYVHQHPWPTIGLAVGVGLVIGLWLARR